MKAILVFKSSTQRFYKLSEPIFKIKNPLGFKDDENIKDLFAELRFKSTKEPVQFDHEKGINYICISDATTHIERLVFAGIPVNEAYGRSVKPIAGKYTFMSKGGSYDDVYEDAVYIRYLARLNKLKYEGVDYENKANIK